MRIEYDPDRDLLYVWSGAVGSKAARTVTVSPGVHADFDAYGRLIGFEVLDATEVLGKKVQFEVALPSGDDAQGATQRFRRLVQARRRIHGSEYAPFVLSRFRVFVILAFVAEAGVEV